MERTAKMSVQVKVVLGSCMLRQDPGDEFWTAADKESQEELNKLVANARRKDIPMRVAIAPLCDFILQQCFDNGLEVVAAYFIRHDLDVSGRYDITDPETGCKYSHLHWVVVAEKRYSLNLWAKGLGVKVNMVEKLNQGKYAKSNALAYLIHIKYPEKVQYDPECVYTATGRDYLKIYDECKENWDKGKYLNKVNRAVSKEAQAELVIRILNNEVYKEDIQRSENYRLLKVYNNEIIENALRDAAEARSQKLKEKLLNGDFSITTALFHGASGSGKTEIAKMFCAALAKWSHDELGEEWRVSLAATKNSIDDYMGEAMFVLNDVGCGKLDADAWKNLLDPHNPAIIGARWKNRPIAAPLNIVASTKDPYAFFCNTALEEDEPIDQFLRRIKVACEVKSLRKAGDPDVKPDDTNTVVSVKTVFYHGDECVRSPLKDSRTPSLQFEKALQAHYSHETPEGMDEWVKPSEAVKYLVGIVAENHGR